MGKKKGQRGGRREGAGRPAEFDDLAKFSVSLDAGLLAELDEFCQANGTTRSAVIRKAIEQLTRKGKK